MYLGELFIGGGIWLGVLVLGEIWFSLRRIAAAIENMTFEGSDHGQD